MWSAELGPPAIPCPLSLSLLSKIKNEDLLFKTHKRENNDFIQNSLHTYSALGFMDYLF